MFLKGKPSFFSLCLAVQEAFFVFEFVFVKVIFQVNLDG